MTLRVATRRGFLSGLRPSEGEGESPTLSLEPIPELGEGKGIGKVGKNMNEK